jgi:hypothetical protein
MAVAAKAAAPEIPTECSTLVSIEATRMHRVGSECPRRAGSPVPKPAAKVDRRRSVRRRPWEAWVA